MRVPNLENMILDHMGASQGFWNQRVKVLALVWYRFDDLKKSRHETITAVSTLRSIIHASFEDSVTYNYFWGNEIHAEIMHRYRSLVPDYHYGDQLKIQLVMDSILQARADPGDNLPY